MAYLVFPTSVGMNRVVDDTMPIQAGVPHERGDEPFLVETAGIITSCSPRAWG